MGWWWCCYGDTDRDGRMWVTGGHDVHSHANNVSAYRVVFRGLIIAEVEFSLRARGGECGSVHM